MSVDIKTINSRNMIILKYKLLVVGPLPFHTTGRIVRNYDRE